jgi:hypothetical protein
LVSLLVLPPHGECPCVWTGHDRYRRRMCLSSRFFFHGAQQAIGNPPQNMSKCCFEARDTTSCTQWQDGKTAPDHSGYNWGTVDTTQHYIVVTHGNTREDWWIVGTEKQMGGNQRKSPHM